MNPRGECDGYRKAEGAQDRRRVRQHHAGGGPAQQDELRIGSYTSISKNWLPQVIRGFSRKYPGVRPYISAIATQDSAVIKMIEQGLGCSILSELVLRGNTDHVSLAPLDPPAWRQLGAGVKSLKAIGRVTKNFLNYIQNDVEYPSN